MREFTRGMTIPMGSAEQAAFLSSFPARPPLPTSSATSPRPAVPAPSAPAPATAPAAAPAMASGAAPTAAPAQERGGFLRGFFGPEGRDARARLAIALEGMTMNPNQALVGELQRGIQARETEAQRNKTVEWLRSRGHNGLADALETGSVDAASVINEALAREKPAAPPEIREVDGRLLSISPDGTVRELYAAPRQGQPEIREVDGRLLSISSDGTVRELYAAPGQGEPQFRRATQEEAAAYGATAGQFGPDGRFYAIDVPQGMTIESDGAGGFRMVQGPAAAGARPFTEGQSKDNVYATRALGALEVLDPVSMELTSLAGKVAGLDPTGFIRGRIQSPEYQVAKNAGDEFLQAILRKDTGAAITSDEQALYGVTYLPQPGDGPEVLEAKRQARIRAVEAIRSGMSPAQMIAVEKALAESGSAATGSAGAGPVRINNDAEYEALPSGTQFIGPDGKLRRKP